MSNTDHGSADNSEIVFACEGKCRICPYPGANCKTITLHPTSAQWETDPHRVWLNPMIEEEIKKLHHAM